MAEYAKQFPQDELSSNPHLACGEFSRLYVCGGEKVARRVKENLPGVKVPPHAMCKILYPI